jgi:hypothetical protein
MNQSQPAPNLDVITDMLIHPDTNYTFFSASKLDSVIYILHLTNQTDAIPALLQRVDELRSNPRYSDRYDE